ncbi:MAG: PEP-CTERM system histidine kinase PrsK [Verrucomicrobiota bacterium]|nr:PEP-CTERM system histidine kinase PrsK [Limisphaera sp.]MDW8382195.1 PEP-CTERM system histidine kinase PrsK [Verrucomicrobiota bacterium]
MDWFPAIQAAAALAAFGLMVAALLVRPRHPAQIWLGGGLSLLAIESLCQWMSFRADTRDSMVLWQKVALLTGSVSAPIWLGFSLTFARGEPARFLSRWRWVLVGLGLMGIGVALAFYPVLILEVGPLPPPGNWYFRGHPVVRLVYTAMVVGAVLVLTQLEWTYRAAVGTGRWRIKYAVVGLGLLFGTRIYTGSQALLYAGPNFQLAMVNAAAVLVACGLVGLALYRSRLGGLDLYPSAVAIHRSLTILLSGVYLVVVGLLATWVTRAGGEYGFPMLAFLLLLAAVGLSVLWMSDRVRQRLRVFVSRHFRRPYYDYRQVWSRFAERTSARMDREELCREVSRLISETFEALSVSIWLLDSLRGRLLLAASTSLPAQQPRSVELGSCLAELASLATVPPQPVQLEEAKAGWCDVLRQVNPRFFTEGGPRWAVPLVSGNELVGFLVVGDRVAGMTYLPEDLELLTCLAEQLGSALRTLNLSEQLAQAREWEAFQAMSAFLVHDLKNTASTLSLMLRNLPLHFDKPEFREDAIRGLSRCAQHINELIGRLTALRSKPQVRLVPTRLAEVLRFALQDLGQPDGITVESRWPDLPLLLLDPAAVRSIVTNLLLNAREAITPPGRITLEVTVQEPWICLRVADTGCGMTPEFIERRLFRPFQTTKKNGLGIGMFQVRTLVELHGGRLEVQSQPGEGTVFRVWLPMTVADGVVHEAEPAHRG